MTPATSGFSRPDPRSGCRIRGCGHPQVCMAQGPRPHLTSLPLTATTCEVGSREGRAASSPPNERTGRRTAGHLSAARWRCAARWRGASTRGRGSGCRCAWDGPWVAAFRQAGGCQRVGPCAAARADAGVCGGLRAKDATLCRHPVCTSESPRRDPGHAKGGLQAALPTNGPAVERPVTSAHPGEAAQPGGGAHPREVAGCGVHGTLLG